jgi:hypothetical protein
LVLGPSIELVENPGELPAATAEAVATARISLQHAGVDQLAESSREDRGADPGLLPELREGEGAPAQLPDQPHRPAPAEEVENAFYCPFTGH